MGGCYEIHTGKVRKILYFTNKSSPDKLVEWIDSKSKQEKYKLTKLLKRIADYEEYPPSKEQFKHEFDRIYVIKSYQIRLYGVKEGNNFIVVHFLQKKTDRLTEQEKSTIRNKLKGYQEWK